MLKGHAVIELKDEVTGRVQRIEHDNMITNGLKYCMTPWLGKFSYASISTSTMQYLTDENIENRKSSNKSMLNHLMGGIFLFQNQLEENVDNVSFPNDNPLTGKASWDAYFGMDTFRGSYNDAESGLQDDGSYKHVWDFSTSQANGQISALALTSYIGGICGNGYAAYDSSEKAISAAPLIDLGRIKISNARSEYLPPFVNRENNEIYYATDRYNLYYQMNYEDQHFSSTGKIMLKRKKIPLTKISPFYDYYNQYIVENIDITVPNDFVTYAKNAICMALVAESYVYVMKSATVNSGGEFKVLRIKISDLTTDILTLTNNTSYALYTSFGAEYTACTDKYIFAWGADDVGSGYLHRINLTNNDISYVHRPTTNYIKTWAVNGYVYHNGYCINAETLEIKRHPSCSSGISTNTVSFSEHYFGFQRIMPGIYLMPGFYAYNSNEYTFAHVCILSNTLMTINNLSSPVTKTASQSMKITYTLTETE